MSMNTYPACGYGLVFTSDQIDALLQKIITTHYADSEYKPTDIHDALIDDPYWYYVDDNGDSNFSATITRIDKDPEDVSDVLLYIPYGVRKTPWSQPHTTKDGYIAEIQEWVGNILPDNYNIEENFVFAQWCQFG